MQYQARLLADAGYPVTMVTMPLRADATGAKFSHPGVDMRCISGRAAFGGRLIRMRHYAHTLWTARRSLAGETVEIAYDPIGMLYSDFVPGRPRRRIAHLHEMLQRHETDFLERRLRTAIRGYELVVVPDTSRGAHTQKVLGLERPPLVVENYPLRAVASPEAPAGARGPRFEVIYCGALGLNQKLDAVIRSIPGWPEYADLVLIGNAGTPTAIGLRRLTDELGLGNRVHFLGWMDTPDAERRLAEADLGIALLDPGFEQWRTALGASNKRYQLMKAGLPQIGDTNPGVPELLEGMGACVDAETHDPAEIAALVTAYAVNPARCAEEGARAFARHQETYNYEQVFRRLQDKIASW